ncbi:MAG: hypothetical protein GF313_08910 [Caldithrix sp.]|nr:hypothetical protein [Caldithrix sp.]
MVGRVKITQYTVYTIVLVLMFGCVNPFAPALSKGDKQGQLILTDQETPEAVLKNFSYAYNFKDSLVYSDLLDSSFQFIYNDFTTDPVTKDSWGRDVDIKTTVGLFHHFQTLNLEWGGTIFENFLNEEKSRKEIKKTFTLTFDGGELIPTIKGEALFIFKKKIMGTLPDTSSIWKITRWEDLSRF